MVNQTQQQATQASASLATTRPASVGQPSPIRTPTVRFNKTLQVSFKQMLAAFFRLKRQKTSNGASTLKKTNRNYFDSLTENIPCQWCFNSFCPLRSVTIKSSKNTHARVAKKSQKWSPPYKIREPKNGPGPTTVSLGKHRVKNKSLRQNPHWCINEPDTTVRNSDSSSQETHSGTWMG